MQQSFEYDWFVRYSSSIDKMEVYTKILTSCDIYSFELLCYYMTALKSDDVMSAILKNSVTAKEYLIKAKSIVYSELERTISSYRLLDYIAILGYNKEFDKMCINATYRAIDIKLHSLQNK